MKKLRTILLVGVIFLGSGTLLARTTGENAGVVDDFPAYDEALLPGKKTTVRTTYENGSEATVPAETRAEKAREEPSGNRVDSGEDGEDAGFLSALSGLFGSDHSLINVIVLIVLVIIFLLYRFRTGNNRRSF